MVVAEESDMNLLELLLPHHNGFKYSSNLVALHDTTGSPAQNVSEDSEDNDYCYIRKALLAAATRPDGAMLDLLLSHGPVRVILESSLLANLLSLLALLAG